MKKLLFTLTLTGALLGSTAITRAEDPKPEAPAARGPGARLNPEERLKRMTETLGLTQDQQDKIKAIFEKDKAKFEEAAKNAKEGCPISKLLNAKITMDTQLEN